MARNYAKAKMEFYPTVNGDINDALLNIRATVPIRALDPSSGDGRTLKSIKEKFNTDEIYGVELDHNRVEETKAICGSKKTIWADALIEARISFKSFNLIFMNPPYDNLDGYGSVKRLEMNFLNKYTPILCANGIMILVVSEALLTNSKELSYITQTKLFSDFYILDVFPSNDYEKFKQWVLILRKKKTGKLPKEYIFSADYFDKNFWDINFLDLKQQQDSTFGYPEESLTMSIDVNPEELKMFKSLRLTDEDILKASLQGKKKINQILTVLNPQDKFKTLLPLKKSHITLLLTTGGLNGRIEGTPFIINGQIDRSVLSNSETEIDENGKEKTTETKISKFTPKVSVMRIDTPEHEIINLN
ncbi:MAG: DUF6094 domain-containing protein [bacterium]